MKMKVGDHRIRKYGKQDGGKAHERVYGDLDMDAIVLAYDDFKRKHGGL